jgi:hypothetical protein
LALAQNEVNIQFRYGNAFEPESLVIITWLEEKASDDESMEKEKQVSGLTIEI